MDTPASVDLVALAARLGLRDLGDQPALELLGAVETVIKDRPVKPLVSSRYMNC